MSHEHNKAIYSGYHDQILDKRFHATSPIRRHAHHEQYQAIANLIPAGATVIDSGCGEGVLSVLLAQKGCIVTGVDLSAPNIASCKRYAEEQGVSDRVTFIQGDAERLPVSDAYFDYAVSSHVLEHLPDFCQGARELARVARKGVVVAIPTCLNPASLVQLGGDKYWTISRKTPYALPLGFFRVVLAFIRGEEGVDEGYAGNADLIHIYRFPWIGKRLLEQSGLKVRSYRASAIVFPYISALLPLSRLLEKGAYLPVLRNTGYGTTYICDVKGSM